MINLLRTSLASFLLLFAFAMTANAGFSDVPAGHRFEQSISYVQEKGVVNGYPDGSFRPENPINRYEFTKIVIGAAKDASIIQNCEGATFPDVATDQ